MIVNTGQYRNALIALVSQSHAMDGGHRAAMVAELEASAYDGLTRVQGYERFCAPQVVPNPVAQGTVARGEWKPDELKNALLQMVDGQGVSAWAKLELMRESTNPQAKILAVQAIATFALQAINLANPLVVAGLDALVAAGVLTTDQRVWLTTMPDPAWTPTVVVESASDRFLGTDTLPDAGEFAECWALAGRS